MTHLVLDEAQAKIVAQSSGPIEIRDAAGNNLGYIAHIFSAEDIALAKQRREAGGRRYTTREVLEHLRELAPE
jgi:hypothetical protein